MLSEVFTTICWISTSYQSLCQDLESQIAALRVSEEDAKKKFTDLETVSDFKVLILCL